MIKIYSTSWWGPCKAAKQLLYDKGLSFEDIDIEEAGINRDALVKLTGGYTVPQIMINDKSIGGFDQLLKLNQEGKLKDTNGNSWNQDWRFN